MGGRDAGRRVLTGVKKLKQKERKKNREQKITLFFSDLPPSLVRSSTSSLLHRRIGKSVRCFNWGLAHRAFSVLLLPGSLRAFEPRLRSLCGRERECKRETERKRKAVERNRSPKGVSDFFQVQARGEQKKKKTSDQFGAPVRSILGFSFSLSRKNKKIRLEWHQPSE